MKLVNKLLFFCLILLAFTACKEDDTAPQVVVSGFTPGNGPVGTTVTIFGTNFSATAAQNQVKFGNTNAVVTASTTTTITTTVPEGATSGKISVTVNGQTGTSATDFTVGGKQVIEITGTISTANNNWTADKVYLMKGNVIVPNGVTLTIAAGTVVKGDKATKATLIIQRGGKINATGTAAQPIVFTSSQPKGERTYGDWGGIIILGKARNNQKTDQNIEGLPTEAAFTYGGTEDADNSGTLKYVRIEFCGIPLSDGNEINGLTMGSVGSGTTIEYVQVSYSGDDAFEWFGGTVNGKYLISYRAFDDDFDTDFGFTGKVQYGLILRDPFIADQSQSNMFECDNSANGSFGTGLTGPLSAAIFANVTSVGGERGLRGTGSAGNVNNANYGRDLHLRRSTRNSIFNSVFLGGNLAGLSLDSAQTGSGLTTITQVFDANDGIQFRGNVFSGTRSSSGVLRGGVFTHESANGFNYAGNGWTANKALFDANNTSGTAIADLKLGNIVTFANITNPTLLPANDSPLLTGAVWTGKADDAFFGATKPTHRGAFGATNWAQGWTNFDPQNTDY